MFKEQFIKNKLILLIDIIFKSASNEFHQVLNIQVEFFGKSYPLDHILMRDKRENTYNTVFNKLKSLFPNFVSKIIITDFKRVLINSLNICFPNSKLNGCIFHLGQSI